LWAGAGVRVYDVKRIYMASRAKNDEKRSKEKRKFGPINYLQFLLGWRLRHQAKIVTLVPSIGKLFAYTRCWQ
jgi:hypothetical protein